jgi:hypothetical protein
MTFSFHPEAKDEFNEAIEYYEDCESGLGYDFSIGVHAAYKILSITQLRGRS